MFAIGVQAAIRAEEVGFQFNGVKFLRVQRTKISLFFVILAVMADFANLVVLINGFLEIGFGNA